MQMVKQIALPKNDMIKPKLVKTREVIVNTTITSNLLANLADTQQHTEDQLDPPHRIGNDILSDLIFNIRTKHQITQTSDEIINQESKPENSGHSTVILMWMSHIFVELWEDGMATKWRHEDTKR
ncbi:hypothetical protein WICPIJ_002901 [Wickerhamomyces pijperi]|uniref:Uncharacterized protein n=1 Tax=Wickerhamomyces pijperi TaxID=599730 RepID=A0A9P8Q840_WICPI|nr:hypothetical protein WICPIJ_002901 [Wickerhamomyces pijperi]